MNEFTAIGHFLCWYFGWLIGVLYFYDSLLGFLNRVGL